ncbi:MAG: MFS transporter [Thaumarchaeota archaeon]|nr:MFS transporter [Nitrososphaerota archaeon]
MTTEVPAAGVGFMASIPTRVKLLIFTQILNTLTFGYFLIYLTAYLVEANVLDAWHVGVVLGLETVVLILTGIPIGVLSDRRGRKWFLILGSFLLPPTFIIFSLTHDFTWYLFASGLAGFAEACALGSWNAIIADQTNLKNRDAAFSLSFIVSNVCLAIGLSVPLVMPALQSSLAVSSEQAHAGSLLWLGVGNFAAPVLIWLLLRNYKETPQKTEGDEGPGDLRLLLKFSGLNGIIGLGAGLIIPLMATWLLYKFAVPDTYSGPFLALSSITIAFAAFGSPRLSKRFGLFRAILMTAGSSTFFMFSLAVIPNVFLAGAAYLVRATLMNMAGPLMDSYLMGIIHPGRRGLASAIAAIVWRLPNSVTTVLGGLILYAGVTTGNSFLYDVPWLGASALYVLGIGLLYLSFRNVKPKG